MRLREEEAYFRKYGRYPNDDDDNLDEQTKYKTTKVEKPDDAEILTGGSETKSSPFFRSMSPVFWEPDTTTTEDNTDARDSDREEDDAFLEEPAALNRPSLEFFTQLKNIYGGGGRGQSHVEETQPPD